MQRSTPTGLLYNRITAKVQKLASLARSGDSEAALLLSCLPKRTAEIALELLGSNPAGTYRTVADVLPLNITLAVQRLQDEANERPEQFQSYARKVREWPVVYSLPKVSKAKGKVEFKGDPELEVLFQQIKLGADLLGKGRIKRDSLPAIEIVAACKMVQQVHELAKANPKHWHPTGGKTQV
jgi:hypothetical protein